jgi:hypothetical protein
MSPIYDHNSLFTMEEEDAILVLLAESLQGDFKFRDLLSLQSKRLRRGAIRRGALLPPSQSAFQYLYDSGQDDALVTLCGFDHAAFNQLHILFKEQFDRFTPYSKSGFIKRMKKKVNCRRLLSSKQCLALYLTWTRTRGSNKVLQIIFGLTPGHLCTWLRFARRLVVKALSDDPRAKVQMPTDELQEFIRAIQENYPALKDCWGAMDGLKLLLQQSGDLKIQRPYKEDSFQDRRKV